MAMPTEAQMLPARVVPPAEPLSTLAYLRALLRNPLEVWPEAAYRDRVYTDRFMGRETLLVLDPDLIERMLIDDADKYRKSDMMMRLLEPALGDGMLNAHGESWRRQRKIVAPIFRPGRIDGFVAKMMEAGKRAGDRLSGLAPGTEVNILDEMMRTTFDVVAETILTGADRLDVPRVQAAIGDYLGGTGWVVALYQLGLPEGLPYPGRGRVTRARNYLRRITAEMVAERRREGKRDDLIQALVDARDEETGEGISDNEIVDNLLTFIAAGHETTALALTWTLYLLSLSPKVEARVLAEIDRYGGALGLAPEAVGELTYTRQVVQEALRLYPSAPSILRQPLGRGEIGGHMVDEKSSIFIPIYAIHRHRALWDNPDGFDPGRFATEAVKARHRFAYLPFGGGPRVCIGMGFSLLESVAILARILPRVQLSPPSEPPIPVAQITLRPRTRMPMAVHRRADAPAKAA